MSDPTKAIAAALDASEPASAYRWRSRCAYLLGAEKRRERERDEARGEVERLEIQLDEARAEIQRWKSDRHKITAEVVGLRAALEKYGGHEIEVCDFNPPPCSCGWDDERRALEGKK